MNLEKKFKICDPLYSYIYLERNELPVFNHLAFQRLRSIRQLGFSDEAFPSATHTRFTHSLGVSHLAGEAFDSIFEKNKGLLSEKKKQVFRKNLRMASLLHDLGHGPFSHSSEVLMPPLKSLNLSQHLKATDRQARHEDYSLKMILEEESLIKALKQMGLEPVHIAEILHPEFSGETGFFKEKGLNFLPLLRQILSSPFDVDRMDYLYRDSLFCGVKYGLIDFVWLIAQMDCHIQNNQGEDQVFLSIDSSALYTLESLILGRQHMRLVVYFHHKSTIYNEMLKKYSKTCSWVLPSNISDYLEFTDSKLLNELKGDKSPYAQKIIERKPYFRLYEASDFSPHFFNAREQSFSRAFGLTKEFLSQKNSLSPNEKQSEQKDDSFKDNIFSFLQEKLNKEGVDFIVVDSQKNSIKPSKKESLNAPVFLENKSLDQVQEWNQASNFLFIPSRRLKRIYVLPEQLSLARKYLRSLL